MNSEDEKDRRWVLSESIVPLITDQAAASARVPETDQCVPHGIKPAVVSCKLWVEAK